MANNSRSKQNEANLEHLFEHIGKSETCAKFQQKPLNSIVVGAQFFRKTIKLYRSWSSVFQTKLPGFSKTLEPCLNIWDFALLKKYYQITKKISPFKPILY